MVFGLDIFSRKPQPPTHDNDNLPVQQLRTPSPSVASASISDLTKNSPIHHTHIHTQSPAPQPPASPSPPPPDQLVVDSTQLFEFLKNIPPKTLHAFILSELSPFSPSQYSIETLTHLTRFFSTLAPPPQLHCVRCHNAFFDVEFENTDHSCLIPHDDDSAEVEVVGFGAGGKTKGTKYETLWGCCGQTVDGDGDSGPPDGWCYEGKHTTDPKRARFRADSTPQDDKLTSCATMRCHDPRPTRSRSTRKRGVPVDFEEESSDDDDASTAAKSAKGRGKAKPKAKAASKSERDTSADVDAESTKPKTTPKPRKKPRTSDASAIVAPEDGDGMQVDTEPELDPKPKPKPRARKKPKTNDEADMDAEGSQTKPKSRAKSMKPKSAVAAAASIKSKAKGKGAVVQLADVIASSVQGEEQLAAVGI